MEIVACIAYKEASQCLDIHEAIETPFPIPTILCSKVTWLGSPRSLHHLRTLVYSGIGDVSVAIALRHHMVRLMCAVFATPLLFPRMSSLGGQQPLGCNPLF